MIKSLASLQRQTGKTFNTKNGISVTYKIFFYLELVMEIAIRYRTPHE
jgi:hypothetical protein